MTATQYHRIDTADVPFTVRRDLMAGVFVTIDGVTSRVSVYGDGRASLFCEVDRVHVVFASEDDAIAALCGTVVAMRKVAELRRGAARRTHLHDDPCGAAELRERAHLTGQLTSLLEWGGEAL